MKQNQGITKVEYLAFQEAYDFFNTELFGDSLPHVLVTLQRHARSKGYFAPERFSGRVEPIKAHELALNPDCFTGSTDEDILSTLAHEMVHVWQQTHGKPGRSGWHNREWAAKMKHIGLHPTDTGEPGGKETGQRMTHYIVADGVYSKAYAKLKALAFQLHWQSGARSKNENVTGSPDGSEPKKSSKTKFTCPNCGQNAWAKPGAHLICGACHEDAEGKICQLLTDDPEDEAA